MIKNLGEIRGYSVYLLLGGGWWLVGVGWAVYFFSSTLRFRAVHIPELREVKPRSARKKPNHNFNVKTQWTFKFSPFCLKIFNSFEYSSSIMRWHWTQNFYLLPSCIITSSVNCYFLQDCAHCGHFRIAFFHGKNSCAVWGF